MYAHVAVQTGDAGIDRPFTYLAPEDLDIEVGRCVVVPFRSREELGYVLALTEGAAAPRDLVPAGAVDVPPEKILPIREVLDTPAVFDRATAGLFGWLSRTYLCGLAAAVRCVIPPYRLAALRTRVRLTPDAADKPGQKLSPAAAKVLETLSAAGGEAELTQLQQRIRSPRLSDAIRQLARRGKIEVLRTTITPSEQRTVLGVRLAVSPTWIEEWRSNVGKRQARQVEVIDAMLPLQGRGIAQAELARQVGCPTTTIQALVKKGLLERVEVVRQRNPLPSPAQVPLALSLTADQTGAVEMMIPALRQAASTASRAGQTTGPDRAGTPDLLARAPRPDVTLLRGVTGSGKTEVYLRLIEETRRLGRQALALVPEISLTAQMIGIYQSRFGTRVAILHSKLSDGERLDEWQRIRRGEVDVVIGARSAIFAPVPDLGLVVLDEEHETTYKQQGDPCYQTRDVAIERARLAGACVVLGSATPSLESAWLAEQGAVRLAQLPRRIDDRPLPAVSLVDQRIELRENPGRIFSRQLEAAILARLSRGEQSILFLNRRGFATITLCRDCGYSARCRNCAVSLTYYASSRLLRCHHCEYTMPAPDTCPKCQGVRIRQFGIGTEKVEQELAALFPDARIQRMDTDSVSRKGSVGDLVERFRRGHVDILVGTQMVTKGFDFPLVTLVGVISADTMLNLPDFRASERTFQVLTQVSGRAGRGDLPGEVIVQTFTPEHYAIQAATRHDFDEFCSQEFPLRRSARYPPYVRMANILVDGSTSAETRSRAEKVAALLKDAIGKEAVELLGPAAAPLIRIKNRFRWHIVLKSEDSQLLRSVCREMRAYLPSQHQPHVSIDLDPVSLL